MQNWFSNWPCEQFYDIILTISQCLKLSLEILKVGGIFSIYLK